MRLLSPHLYGGQALGRHPAYPRHGGYGRAGSLDDQVLRELAERLEYLRNLEKRREEIAAALEEQGVIIHYDTEVKAVRQLNNGKYCVHTDLERFPCDKAIVTTSPQSMLGLCDQLPESYKDQLRALKHLGAVVLCVRLKHPLSPQGYYWYNLPKSEGYPFLALVEHTNYVPKERYNNETIVYAGDYQKNNTII